MCNQMKFYEAGFPAPCGTYVCAGCSKETVYITSSGMELPVCNRCRSNIWEKKSTANR